MKDHIIDEKTGISYILQEDYYIPDLVLPPETDQSAYGADDYADFEKKKMIVNCLIRRVDVFKDYKLKIDFNFNFQQLIDFIA